MQKRTFVGLFLLIFAGLCTVSALSVLIGTSISIATDLPLILTAWAFPSIIVVVVLCIQFFRWSLKELFVEDADETESVLSPSQDIELKARLVSLLDNAVDTYEYTPPKSESHDRNSTVVSELLDIVADYGYHKDITLRIDELKSELKSRLWGFYIPGEEKTVEAVESLLPAIKEYYS